MVDELGSQQLIVPPPPIQATTSAAINNDAGPVLFQASLIDGSGVFAAGHAEANQPGSVGRMLLTERQRW